MTAAELIKLRERFGWSQAEAARQLGCSLSSIHNWEKGVNKIPDSIALAAAAVAMNLPPYGLKQR
jgi:transcriptional regulator with XRE-family HTH domain